MLLLAALAFLAQAKPADATPAQERRLITVREFIIRVESKDNAAFRTLSVTVILLLPSANRRRAGWRLALTVCARSGTPGGLSTLRKDQIAIARKHNSSVHSSAMYP